MRSVHPSGDAPTAVANALRHALWGTSTTDESAWIQRIELLRQLLLRSPEVLEIADYGAGENSRYDTAGDGEQVHMTKRTLGAITQISKRPRAAYLLFRLIRELRPKTVVELGSCVGISACYQAAALELNQFGSLITLEGSPILADRSRRSIEELGLSHRATVRQGPFAETLAPVLSEVKSVSFAFIDGNHVESATVDYMNAFSDVADSEAVLVFDDIHWSEGMERAWARISQDPRFALTVDVGTLGLAVISESASSRLAVRLPYA